MYRQAYFIKHLGHLFFFLKNKFVFQSLRQSYGNQNSVALTKRHIDKWKRIENSVITLYLYSKLTFDKMIMYALTHISLWFEFPGNNTGLVCHFLLQAIFLTQVSKSCLMCLLHWQVDFLPTEQTGRPFWQRYQSNSIEEIKYF